MNVEIDGVPIDVQLEDEKYLSQFLLAVDKWLWQDQRRLKGFSIKGTNHALPPACRIDAEARFTSFSQELSSIEHIQLYSMPPSEPMPNPTEALIGKQASEQASGKDTSTSLVQSLKTLSAFFGLAQNSLRDQKFFILQDLFSDSQQLFELLHRTLSNAESQVPGVQGSRSSQASYPNPLVAELETQLEQCQCFESIATTQTACTEEYASLLALFCDIELLLKELQEDLQQGSPASESQENLAQLKVQLKEEAKALEDASIPLQDGQTAAIMHAVANLSTTLEKVLHSKDLQKNRSAAELFARLSPFLQELTNAIESHDTITIGDLIEYEIQPILQCILEELL